MELGQEMTLSSIWVKCERERRGVEMAGRGAGIVVWSFVGLCVKEVSHFADSEEKISNYTREETREKRGLWGQIVLKQFFTLICGVSCVRQKTLNCEPQMNV